MTEYAYKQKIRERDEITSWYRGREQQILDFKQKLLNL